MTKEESKPRVDMDAQTATEEMPDVQEHAIQALQAEKQSELDKAKADGFNPEIHQTDARGNPVKTKSGRWAKKRGAKPKDFKRPGDKKQAENDAPKSISMDSIESARMVSEMLEGLSVKLIGDEWQLSEAERAGNISAWAATFDYYGGVKISPPAALALSHMQIIITRAGKPKTASKFKLFGAWMKSKFTFKKSKKEKGESNALSDSRQDVKRKIDVGEKESK